MGNTLLDLSASLSTGYAHRTVENSSGSGLQTEAALGPRIHAGRHSLQLDAFYQNTILSHDFMGKNESNVVHTLGGRLGYGLALHRDASLHATVGAGWANYQDRLKYKDFGGGFSAQLGMNDGAHFELGGSLCTLGDRLCLTGVYSKDYSILKAGLNAHINGGSVTPSVTQGALYAFDVEGMNVLLRVDLMRLLETP